MQFRPRIGLLALHWGMFDPVMPAGYRREKEALAQHAAEVLAHYGEVVYPGLVTDEASGAAAGLALQSRADMIVVFPCMAAPPAFPWAALAGLHDIPVLIWNCHLLKEIPEDFNAADLVRHSSNVGSIMLTNVLLRHGRRFRLVTGSWDNEGVHKEIGRAIYAGAAAARLRRARLGVFGDTLQGYLNLAMDRETLKRDLGIEIVDIFLEELTQSYRAVPDARVQEVLGEMRAWNIRSVNESEQRNSARLAVCLNDLVQKYHLAGGTVNCRSQYFLTNPHIGIVACYAVSRLLQYGVPFTCTGDIPTAIAALILKLLGGQAQWCECNVIDFQGEYMLLTDTGEGDPGIASDPKCIEVISNERFRKGGCGACVRFQFRAGPATLLGFSQLETDPSGWSLVVAAGEIINKYFPYLGVPNAGFRFSKSKVAEAFNSWCLAGATHHAVVTTGDYMQALCDIADFLGISKSVM